MASFILVGIVGFCVGGMVTAMILGHALKRLVDEMVGLAQDIRKRLPDAR